MTYQDNIRSEMQWLSRHKKAVFIGEGLKNAGEIYGTMSKVPTRKCLEMPIAENLIVGSAIGLSIGGFRPIVVFQRMDFMLIAADAIINHVALLPKMSGGQLSLPMIIRAIIGSQDPKFDVGRQHNKDLRYIFRPYIVSYDYTPGIYKKVYKMNEPVLVTEWKDKYNETYHTTRHV